MSLYERFQVRFPVYMTLEVLTFSLLGVGSDVTLACDIRMGNKVSMTSALYQYVVAFVCMLAGWSDSETLGCQTETLGRKPPNKENLKHRNKQTEQLH